MNRVTLHIVICLLPSLLLAQESSSIKMKANVNHGLIELRWAVTSPTLWELSRESGFTLERYTIIRNGEILSQPESTVLASNLGPAFLSDWEPYIDDDYVAIMAQALYGESFDVSAGSQISQAINKAREIENRFSFAMFAADQSKRAADLAGLYFRDEKVFADEKYLYKVYPNLPIENLEMDTASVFIGLGDDAPLPAPRDVQVEFGDQVAIISWDARVYQDYYTAFWIEKSLNRGQTFERLSDKPFVTIENLKENRAYTADSLDSNDQRVLYRVLGVSPFEELSIPSDTIGGNGLGEFNFQPIITSDTILLDGSIGINWSFPEGGLELLDHFDVIKKNPTLGVTIPVARELEPTTRLAYDKEPWSGSYYMIRAVDVNDRATTSFPYLIQMEDSIPPLAPIELTGEIDTLGHVSIEWTSNDEPDLLGYKVYKSNHEDGAYIQLPGEIIETNSFDETIDINNLTSNIYYKVVALDQHFNPSGFSKVLSLSKPDIIPPVAPVFTKISGDSLGILVKWIPSSSVDLAKHLLYRRKSSSEEWVLLRIIEKGASEDYYLDRNVENGLRYAYTMIAVDEGQLESTPAVPVTLTWVDKSPIAPVENLVYQIGDKAVEISWTYDQVAVGFEVFKFSTENDRYQLFKSISGEERSISDSYRIGSAPKYKVIAIAESGRYSLMSEEVVVR